mmetsp:Transcript_109357/g.223406  ORF Transcript_109357/g.223406 Transcript_109357/m.223406 type:complete len:409 (+) Transcript_109357:1499-2725(+)
MPARMLGDPSPCPSVPSRASRNNSASRTRSAWSAATTSISVVAAQAHRRRHRFPTRPSSASWRARTKTTTFPVPGTGAFFSPGTRTKPGRTGTSRNAPWVRAAPATPFGRRPTDTCSCRRRNPKPKPATTTTTTTTGFRRPWKTSRTFPAPWVDSTTRTTRTKTTTTSHETAMATNHRRRGLPTPPSPVWSSAPRPRPESGSSSRARPGPSARSASRPSPSGPPSRSGRRSPCPFAWRGSPPRWEPSVPRPGSVSGSSPPACPVPRRWPRWGRSVRRPISVSSRKITPCETTCRGGTVATALPTPGRCGPLATGGTGNDEAKRNETQNNNCGAVRQAVLPSPESRTRAGRGRVPRERKCRRRPTDALCGGERNRHRPNNLQRFRFSALAPREFRQDRTAVVCHDFTNG